MCSPGPLLAFATNGFEERFGLLSEFNPSIFGFDHEHKLRSFGSLLRVIRSSRPNLVCMEGSGIAGGAAVILARLAWGTKFVVSSGDAIGPYVGSRARGLGLVFGVYERLLYRLCSGFIGWTPYLVGRALSSGAPRAMTAAGWAPFEKSASELRAARANVRARLGIESNAIVIGIAGAIRWNRRIKYCYGLELVKALELVRSPDVHALIVGNGNGLARLKQLVGPANGSVHFTGQVSRDAVPDYLAAMDIASLPQTLDRVGAFRYSTKLSEYLSVGLPVVTGRLPLSYDLPGDWLWRLPGDSPSDDSYIHALADLLEKVTTRQLKTKRTTIPRARLTFDRPRQVERVTAFIRDLLDD